MSNSWNETLFGCFNDMGSCLYGFCCLPCLFGTNAEKVDGTTCVGMCCAYMLLTECYLCGLPHYVTRKKLREKFNLEEDEQCNDILTVIFCSPCGICQEARELKSREGNAGAAYQVNNSAPVMLQPGSNPKFSG